MPVRQINGIEIHYEDHGSGTPVLLVMGSGARGRVWGAHQVPALVEAGYRVVTFDHRGVPPTDECTGGFGLPDMVADTAGLIRELGLAPCHVVGTSLGATVAQELAADHPALVRRLVLMATRYRVDALREEMARAERELHDSGVRLPESFRAVWEAVQNLSPATVDDERSARDWLDVLGMSAGPRGRGARIHMDVSDIGDRREVCTRIRARTLVVAFADDVINTVRLCREVADAVPDGRLEVVRDAGHYGYLERPAEVNHLLLTFLKD